jgi:hypothetical protein
VAHATEHGEGVPHIIWILLNVCLTCYALGMVHGRLTANAAGQGAAKPYPAPASSALLVAQPPRDVSELYNELLYAVARKFPGESRHDTALRYIREREEAAQCDCGACKQNSPLCGGGTALTGGTGGTGGGGDEGERGTPW